MEQVEVASPDALLGEMGYSPYGSRLFIMYHSGIHPTEAVRNAIQLAHQWLFGLPKLSRQDARLFLSNMAIDLIVVNDIDEINRLLANENLASVELTIGITCEDYLMIVVHALNDLA